MTTARRTFLSALFVGAATVTLTFPALAQTLTPDEAKAIAEEAYIYGYSLISVEMSRKVITNVEKPATTRAPMGRFANLREYPSAAFRDVTAPNADTLYSNAFIDVSKEPWIVSWPDMGDRYYLWEFYDAWVPVIFDPGSRTTGQKAQTYAITGPGWSGTLSAGVKQVKSPTATIWLHRDARGLQGCLGAAGSIQALSAQFVGQGIRPALGQGLSNRRHEAVGS
jgi:hypothetical protein